jgi:hypothetical protein
MWSLSFATSSKPHPWFLVNFIMSDKYETGLFLRCPWITGDGPDDALGTRRSCPDRPLAGLQVLRGPKRNRNGRKNGAGATPSSNGSDRAYEWSADHKKRSGQNNVAGATPRSSGSDSGPRTAKNIKRLRINQKFKNKEWCLSQRCRLIGQLVRIGENYCVNDSE